MKSNDCFIKASRGLDSLSLLDEMISNPGLLLNVANPWDDLKKIINMEAKLPSQRLERLNKEIDHIHTAIDKIRQSETRPKEIKRQLSYFLTDLKDEAQMEILEDLVDCACKSG